MRRRSSRLTRAIRTLDSPRDERERSRHRARERGADRAQQTRGPLWKWKGLYTKEELEAAFDLVADPADWRGPIHALVKLDEKELVACAIAFFTGTEATFKLLPSGLHYAVRSVGYRNGPCGP